MSDEDIIILDSDPEEELEIVETTDEELEIESSSDEEEEFQVDISNLEELNEKNISDGSIESEGKLIIDERSSDEYRKEISEELKSKEEVLFKGDKFLIYQKAFNEKVPVQYIYNLDGKLKSLYQLLDDKLDISQNFKRVLEMEIKIAPKDFQIIYFNFLQDRPKEYIIRQLNTFRKVTEDSKYFIESFDIYKNQFLSEYRFNMDVTNTQYKNYVKLFQKIDDFPYTQDIGEIINSFSLDTTIEEFEVTDDGYPLTLGSGNIVFDQITCNIFFKFIRLDIKGESKWKVFTINNNNEGFIDKNKEIEYQEGRIFLFYTVNVNGRDKISYVEINLETSTVEISYMENKLELIKNEVIKVLPELQFIKQLKKSVKGEFEMTFVGYQEFKFYYLTLFNEIFSQFFYIREIASVRSMKENLKIYYTGTENTNRELDYSLYFYIKPLLGNIFNISFTSKFTSKHLLKEFIVILNKLSWYYNNIEDDQLEILKLIETPYTGPDGEGFGGKFQYSEVEEDRVRAKKIDILTGVSEDLFRKSSYVRNCPCPKQPIIIPKDDVEDWKNYVFNGKKRNVVLFPPENSTHRVPKNYYVCPGDEYPIFSLRENPNPNSSYPLIPCCVMKETSNQLYQDYDLIRRDPDNYWVSREQFKGKGKAILKTLKTLSFGRDGYPPSFIEDFLKNVIQEKVLREGVSKSSKNSFIHCVLRGVSGLSYKINNKNYLEKWNSWMEISKSYNSEKGDNAPKNRELLSETCKFGIVGEWRKQNKIPLETCYQENFDIEKGDLKNIILSKFQEFDSSRFYRFMEVAYQINIFTFIIDKTDEDNCYLEIPNHRWYHEREIKENLPCLIILKHMRKENFSVYELIKSESEMETGSRYLFSSKVTKFFQNYIYSSNNFQIYKGSLLKNPNRKLNWNFLLKDYKIISQKVNDSGRCYSINFEIKPDKQITIFIPSSFPLPVKHSEEIMEGDGKEVREIFGDDYTVGDEGYWYSVGGWKNGVFIPIRGTKEKDNPNLQCREYKIIRGREKRVTELQNIRICSRNSSIILQIIEWLFITSGLEMDQWLEKYLQIDEEMNQDIFSNVMIDIPYRFPKIEEIDVAMEYFSKYIPSMFGKKIFLYPELHRHVTRYMKNLSLHHQGQKFIKGDVITGIYKTESDFTKRRFNRIIIDSEKYQFWVDSSIRKRKKVEDIEETSINLQFPSIWRNGKDNRIYFLQNNSGHKLDLSVLSCYLWRVSNGTFQPGFNFNCNNVWDVLCDYFKDDDGFIELGWNLDSIREYVYLKTMENIYFPDIFGYAMYLAKNRIGYKQMKEISYIVYSKNSSENIIINDTFITDTEEPLEVYLYSDGGYGSLLPVV